MTRRDGILREMGLGPIWRLRGTAVAQVTAISNIAPGATRSVADETPTSDIIAPTVPTTAPVAPPPEAPQSDIATLDWEALTERIVACRACGLCEQRRNAVPGVGDRQADWLFVGEGPGAEEDARGEPFVGKAGKLLDAMLAAIGLSRDRSVFIANTVKCRPPANRTPLSEELAACFPFLARQIALLQPKLIVALGRPAAQSLLNTEIRIASVRGRCFDYHGIPVVVTYHPAYLLRNPMDKAKAWEDLCFARQQMARLSNDGVSK